MTFHKYGKRKIAQGIAQKRRRERENQQITESGGEYFGASNDLCNLI